MNSRKVIGVDIGNTSIKAAEFHLNDTVGDIKRFNNLHDLKAYYGEAYYVFCAVAKGDFQKEFPNCFQLAVNSPIPLKIDYDTPQTLGVDRIAAAVGAWQIFPDTNLLIIDSGTCVTYDLVTSDGTYRGGIISPGLDIRYRAMHEYTGALPRLHSGTILGDRLSGKSTEECMRIGAEQGLKNEMKGFLESFNKKYDHLQVVMTGGLDIAFESKLKAPIFANSKIVLTGLHAIWKFNEGI